MKAIIRAAILTVLMLFSLTSPAFAEYTPTKAAVTRMISKETKDKVTAQDIIRIVSAVFKEANRHKLDPFLLVSLIGIESGYRPWAVNKSGARGLTQVIPRYHRDKIRGRDIMNIETNIEVGTQVLVDCLQRNNGVLKKASRCYSGSARDYVTKLKDGYKTTKIADIVYRFENELPLVVNSNFETPNEFSISVNTVISPPPLLVLTTLDLIRGNAY